MKALQYIAKTREYLDYLETHILNVQNAWNEVRKVVAYWPELADDYVFHTLENDIICHDLSKFSSDEFTQYRAAFYPVDGETTDDAAFQRAWEHHYESNYHHHEHMETNRPDVMSVVHMYVDWLAMSYVFNGTPKSFYDRNKEKIDANLSPPRRELLNKLFKAMGK